MSDPTALTEKHGPWTVVVERDTTIGERAARLASGTAGAVN
ncbi:hypothetical protein [Salinibacterium sp. ZJ454]|nr:hypothetical protein [Salinibacterium sp. ZJ454]